MLFARQETPEPTKPPPPIEAWLVGGPHHNTTQYLIPGLATEVSVEGHLYRRRPRCEDIEVPRANRDYTTDASYVFAAYFDFDESAAEPSGEGLPVHRTEAGWPRCSTCDGGGCPDCTDPA